MAILPENERLSYAQRILQPARNAPLIVARTETVLETDSRVYGLFRLERVARDCPAAVWWWTV